MFTKNRVTRGVSVCIGFALALAVLLASAAFPTTARALGATITVNSILDNTIAGDSFCTLREAINNANANSDTTNGDCTAGLAGTGDKIVFSNLLVVHTITLTSALPMVSDTTGLTIDGADTFTISGNDLYRVVLIGGSAVLTLENLNISHGKITSGVGGGVFNAAGTLTVTNCLFSSNSSAGGFGGGIENLGTLTVTDSIFSSNTSTYVPSAGGRGGGIYNGTGATANITTTIFSGNSANIRGGGLYNYLGTVTITDSLFQSNSMNSTGDGGGGIYNDQGTLIIKHSAFSSNTANNPSSNGGAILSIGAGSVVTITTSTFSDNSVTSGVGGAIGSNGIVLVTNSTIFRNYADSGAGIYNGLGGQMTSINNTFSANTSFFAGVVGGGIYNEATLNLYNSIIANTVNGGDCYNSTTNGTVNGNNNLIEDASSNACGLTNGINGNIIGADPNLGAVTLLNPVYFPLNAGSPAINTGDDAKCAAAPVNNTSQNGVTRPQGSHCDMGSSEYVDTTTPTVVSITRANPSPTNLASVDFTVTFSEAVSGVDASDFSLTTAGVSGPAITGVSGSGASYTVTANTGSGNGTLRLDLIDNDSIVDAMSTPLGGTGAGNGNFTSGEVYTIDKTLSLTLNSIAAQDGSVLESSETSNVGGTINSLATTFALGDDAARRQYRTILSFSTGATLPDNAVITSVTLNLKKQAIIGGGNPLSIFHGLILDLKNGSFGTAALQASDFQAPASQSVGPLSPVLTGSWYSVDLTGASAAINKLGTGLTQIRLRFRLDDNNNAVANILSLFSGNAVPANRPQLIITYYVP